MLALVNKWRYFLIEDDYFGLNATFVVRYSKSILIIRCSFV